MFGPRGNRPAHGEIRDGWRMGRARGRAWGRHRGKNTNNEREEGGFHPGWIGNGLGSILDMRYRGLFRRLGFTADHLANVPEGKHIDRPEFAGIVRPDIERKDVAEFHGIKVVLIHFFGRMA